MKISRLSLWLLCLWCFQCCTHPLKELAGKTKAPFDGEMFENIEPFARKRFTDFFKWWFVEKAEKWPEWVVSQYRLVPLKRVGKGEIQYNVINHATVLIQTDEVNILTDPIWSRRTSPVSWAGPKRVRNPGIRFESLPPIDLVVISHNHYDHLDIPTLKRLEKEHSPVVLVGLANGQLLKSAGIKNVVEMDWWDSYKWKGLKISFVPSQHWSGRGFFDRFKTLWGGFYFHAEKGGIYFAGDTGYGKFFRLIREKLGAPVLSFIPIGAYRPRWFMKTAHINPREAVLAHQDLASLRSVGIHFGTFQLTDEGIDKPKIELHKSLKNFSEKLNRKVDFRVPDFGTTYSF